MGGIFSTPKTPVVPPPAPMPTPDDELAAKAKKKAIVAATTRSGRQSTILTEFGQNRDKLGG